MNLFISTLQDDPFYYLTWVLVAMFSICVHEFAHAWTATREGDETAAWLGHLSLNPRIQMGWTSIIMLLLLGIAWGAVPVNVRNLRNHWSQALVAVAGPVANLILSFLFAGAAIVAGKWVTPIGGENLVAQFFAMGSMINAVLCLFNLLPVPMFDGWPVLSLFIPAMARVDVAQMRQLSFFLLMVLWMSPALGVIWSAGAWLSGRQMGFWAAVFGLGA